MVEAGLQPGLVVEPVGGAHDAAHLDADAAQPAQPQRARLELGRDLTRAHVELRGLDQPEQCLPGVVGPVAQASARSHEGVELIGPERCRKRAGLGADATQRLDDGVAVGTQGCLERVGTGPRREDEHREQADAAADDDVEDAPGVLLDRPRPEGEHEHHGHRDLELTAQRPRQQPGDEQRREHADQEGPPGQPRDIDEDRRHQDAEAGAEDALDGDAERGPRGGLDDEQRRDRREEGELALGHRLGHHPRDRHRYRDADRMACRADPCRPLAQGVSDAEVGEQVVQVAAGVGPAHRASPSFDARRIATG